MSVFAGGISTSFLAFSRNNLMNLIHGPILRYFSLPFSSFAYWIFGFLDFWMPPPLLGLLSKQFIVSKPQTNVVKEDL